MNAFNCIFKVLYLLRYFYLYFKVYLYPQSPYILCFFSLRVIPCDFKDIILKIYDSFSSASEIIKDESPEIVKILLFS